jgi:two-component system cell cycle response regulator
MHANSSTTFLLASPEPALLAEIEPVLLASGACVEVVLSAEAALAVMTAPVPPSLALLDANLPGIPMDQLLAAVHAEIAPRRLPIILIADAVTQQYIDRLAEGAIDDLILRTAESPYWRLRIDLLLRTQRWARELDSLREAEVQHAQTDRLTGVYNRETILALLFRETDRVQRMKSPLSLILLDIDDFGHWNTRLGAEACDNLLCQVASRIARLLRSYDLLGRPGMDEFLVAMPGCATVNAVLLAERLRLEVFGLPFHLAGESIRLSACFGIASSQGRAPVVVLREAEEALQWAKAAGPETIQCAGDCPASTAAPVAFLSPSSGDELLAW